MKSKLPIIAAVIVAIAAVVLIRAYVNKLKAEAAERDKGPTVAAARIDLQAGTVLEKKMLTVKQVPERFLPPRAVKDTPDNVKIVIGQKLAMPLKEGQILQWTDLAGEQRGGFESVIPMGERAFTVRLTGGVKGGLLQPGDHVDVLVNFAIPEAKGARPQEKPEASWRARSEIVNIVLLQNVTVLSVGDTFTFDTKAAKGTGEITLDVTLQEAQLLMFAAQHGDLAAALRKREDIQTVARDNLPRVTFESLEKLVGDLDSQRKKRTIEIMKGGTVERVTVEDKTSK